MCTQKRRFEKELQRRITVSRNQEFRRKYLVNGY